MPESLRALVVILLLSALFFKFAEPAAFDISGKANFVRRRNLWYILTIIAFIAHSFWVYAIFTIILLIKERKRESNIPALFFFLLFVLPMATVQISGLGLMSHIFDLTHARLLELFILLPAYLKLRKQGSVLPFGKTWTDVFFAAYLILDVAFTLRGNNWAPGSFTNTLREAFVRFIDIFLPYYVISRSLRSIQDFRDALHSLVMSIGVLAPLAIFEAYKFWLLYSAATNELGMEGKLTGYMSRGDMLRAIVTTGQPIVLGYIMLVGIGSYLYLQRFVRNKNMRLLGIGLLVAGLIASVSRGPWVAAVALAIVFIATGQYALRRFIFAILFAGLALGLASALPEGEKYINMLPFVGTSESENVTYRQDLLTNSMIVIERNFWFGSADYLSTPEMQSMIQGEGIIDIVNSFIGVALERGVVGLGLFVTFFVLILLGLLRSLYSIRDKASEEHLLGQALLATMTGILVTIFTVSSITFVPIIYWSMSAVSVAYMQMIKTRTRNA